MLLDRGRATDAILQTEARKKPVPPIEITEAYGPPIIWYDRLINLSMSFTFYFDRKSIDKVF